LECFALTAELIFLTNPGAITYHPPPHIIVPNKTHFLSAFEKKGRKLRTGKPSF
jgi:hypothetical protein